MNHLTKLFLATTVAPLLWAGQAQAAAGDWYVRVRAIDVIPNEKSGYITPGVPAGATDKVKVGNSIVPEVDVTYMATNNVGFELIAATSKHKVSGDSGVPAAVGRLASAWVLPPTLTAQYHFAPDAKVRPYVGAGINYTLFYSEKASSAFKAAAGPTSVHMKSSFGWAAQAGVDVAINDKMFVNFDIKYIDIRTTARLNTTNLGVQRVRVKLNPIVLGMGIGFKL